MTWGGWKIKEKKYFKNSFMEILIPTLLVVRKLSLFSGMWNDALLHREGLEG